MTDPVVKLDYFSIRSVVAKVRGAIIIKSIKFKSCNDVLKVEQIDQSQENRFHETSEVRQKGISRHYFGKQTIEFR